MDKIRVIHIITKLELGGAQENTIFTVSHLNRDLFHPALWSGPGGILTQEVSEKLGEDFQLIPALVREISPGRDILALFQIYRMLLKEKKQNPDSPIIVHTHSSKAGILGRWASFWAGIPLVIHSFHGFGFNDFQPFYLRWFFINLERLTARFTDSFIFVSRANMAKALKLKIGINKSWHLIRSGVEIEKFRPQSIDLEKKKKDLGVGEGKLVTMVSCLKPQKNPLDFARSARLVLEKVPDAWFIVCGDGELRAELEKLVQELGIKERFKLLGWRRDIPEILWASDLLVLTSLWEGLPRVYPQAMASELAIVGTRVDGAPEAVINGETGYLVPPKDYQGLAEKIIALLKNEEKRKQFGKKGASLVKEFDIWKMVKDQEELYLKLLREKGLWN